MDGGLFGSFGGGDFEMKICRSNEAVSQENLRQGGDVKFTMDCCHTGNLNTAVNNWERGQQNFFVGRQLGNCEYFRLNPEFFTSVTIQHSGTDGGKIEWIKLRGSDMKKDVMFCPVARKLDNEEHYTASCQAEKYIEGGLFKWEDAACNGRTDFCDMKFNEFTFPGAHNAGTGQMDDPNLSCFYKNHDLNVKEQLDFGIRFLDLDVIYSTSGKCEGLETGHGANNLLYQCMGSLTKYFEDMKAWMDENPREVVVVHIGEIKNREEAMGHIHKMLTCVYPDFVSGINTHFQETGEWPTLGQAIQQRRQLFVMIKFNEEELVSENNHPERFIKVLKVKTPRLKPSLPRGTVSVMSAYGGGYVGDHCIKRVDRAEEKCRTMDADFTKLAAYGTHTNDAVCLSDTAEQCNARIPQILKACKKHKRIVNFLFADYPNYLGEIHYTLPEITENENLSRV